MSIVAGWEDSRCVEMDQAIHATGEMYGSYKKKMAKCGRNFKLVAKLFVLNMSFIGARNNLCIYTSILLHFFPLKLLIFHGLFNPIFLVLG